MQVVKNDFLAGLERDGRYKLLQVHYALMLERENTKDEILERYLNTVFFGNNAYGIQAAAETYFGKTADQLTFIEAAFLAGLVRAPSAYDPINNPERSRARFTQVLERLVDDGYSPSAEAATLGDGPSCCPSGCAPRPSGPYTRTYYTEALRDYLLNRSDILGDTYEERYSDAVPRRAAHPHDVRPEPPAAGRGGPQRAARHARRASTPRSSSLDTQTGAIRAMVGGAGFVPGEREINMALAPRQTGLEHQVLHPRRRPAGGRPAATT